MTSVDAANGQVIKQGRIPDAGGTYHSSPIVADGKVYISSMTGKVSVLSAEGEWEVLAVNDFGERIEATPAVGSNKLYIRTEKALYCVGR